MSAWQWLAVWFAVEVLLISAGVWFVTLRRDRQVLRRPRVRWDLETDEPNWEPHAPKIR